MVAVTAQRVDTPAAIPEAVERLASAAERAAAARLDLALHGITKTAKSYGLSAALVVVALVVGVFAWICIVAGSVALLSSVVHLGLAFLIVGVAQLVLAAAIVLPVTKTLRATRLTPEPK